MTIKNFVQIAGHAIHVGLSTDTKPSSPEDYYFLEEDTKKWFRRTGGAWVEIVDPAYSNAISAVNVVSNALSNEISVRASAVNAISNAISNEISIRASAVNAVSNAASNALSIANAASAAVNVVSNALSNEISVRASAVNAVSNVASNALSVANAASNAASIVSNALSNEISNRASAVNAVSNVASNALSVANAASQAASIVSNALSNEISNRASAINVVSNAASNALSIANAASNAASIVSNALSNEISNRASADAALSNRVGSLDDKYATMFRVAATPAPGTGASAFVSGAVVRFEGSAGNWPAFRRASAGAVGSAAGWDGILEAGAGSNTKSVRVDGLFSLSVGQWVALGVGGASGLSKGQKYYLGAAGKITNTPAANEWPLGVAVSHTGLLLRHQAYKAGESALDVVSNALSNEISNRASAVNAVSNVASNALSVANAASQAASVVSADLVSSKAVRKVVAGTQLLSTTARGVSGLTFDLSAGAKYRFCYGLDIQRGFATTGTSGALTAGFSIINAASAKVKGGIMNYANPPVAGFIGTDAAGALTQSPVSIGIHGASGGFARFISYEGYAGSDSAAAIYPVIQKTSLMASASLGVASGSYGMLWKLA